MVSLPRLSESKSFKKDKINEYYKTYNEIYYFRNNYYDHKEYNKHVSVKSNPTFTL